MRVLIVEDEPNLGRQLRSTLEGAGYAVDLATDGEDGHYLGATESYDAVILDLGLPEIDGLTVLDRWRKEGWKRPAREVTSGEVTKAGEPVKLTAQEYRLLSYLMHHKGKVVSRTELIEHIYDQDFDRDSNTIEVFVTRIRKKLGADVITTLRGLGYSLEEPAS